MFMIWGGDDHIPLTRQQAATAAGIADVTLRQALGYPMVLKFYNEQIEVLRTGERPKSIHRIAELRDKAQSERVQLEASKYLDTGDRQSGGVQVNVGVNIAPGYQVDVSQHVQGSDQLLKLAGSTRNVLESHKVVDLDE